MIRALRNSAPIIALVILLFVSLYSISDATSNSATFGKYYNILVFFNAVGLITLLGLIAYNVFKLMMQYRIRAVGSRLTTRMIGTFLVLTIIPVSIVYYFSLTFIHRSIDSWFDVGVEQALEDSLQLGRSALDLRKREALKKARQIANEIPAVREELLIVYLNDARINHNANELTLVGLNGVILGSSSENSAELPQALSKTTFGVLDQDDHYLDLEESEDTGLNIRIVVPVQTVSAIEQSRTLQALFPITDQLNQLTGGVQSAYEQYRELAVIRNPLKTSFTLALSVVWLLSVFSAVLIAFIAARRLVSPINDLVQGTQSVAAGDYETQLPYSGDDELSVLTRSFNTMTRKLAQAREVADQSQLMEAMQKNYLESVLEHINSGVLTVAEGGIIKHGNRAVELIFDWEPGAFSECSIDDLGEEFPQLQHFFEVLARNQDSAEEWQEEVIIFGASGRKVLRVRGSELNQHFEETREQVVVVDDLTQLIQAQKDSAWGEMARRLAHEIKNPLTPIQLSAERLQRKLSGQVVDDKQELLDRYTHTIVQQVEAMKTMVNNFTDYARSSTMSRSPINFNQLVEEVLQLYIENAAAIKIELSLEPSLPDLQADPVRLRQLIHNLVKNATESLQRDGEICIATKCMEEYGCFYIRFSVEDSGPGVASERMDDLFEPYVTDKPGGNGLGLAIVKKIVDEHGGRVWVDNLEPQGARFCVLLPVLETVREES